LIGAIVFLLLFYGIFHFNTKWANFSSSHFISKLIPLSFTINISALAFVYLICYLYDGSFFEPNAADSVLYHQHGIDLANNFKNADFNVSNYLNDNDYSDFGYNVFLGIIYWLIGPYTLVARIFNAVFLTLTVKAIFQITEIIFDLKTAKTAALISVFSPYLLFFVGVNLKESFMIYILMLANLQSVKILITQNNNYKNYILLIASVLCLFFLRTVLGMVFCVSFAIFYYMNTTFNKNIYKIAALIGLLLSATFIANYLNSIGITEKVISTFDQSNSQTDAELSDKISKGGSGGLSVKTTIVIPLLFVSVLVAPFSTLVLLDEQIEIAWLFPGGLTKNILVFFAFTGLWNSFKYLRIKSALILSCLFLYLIVIAVSAQSTSMRYQLVALPFIHIFIAFGLQSFNPSRKNLWHIYLLVIFFTIVAWNYFKLSIRNLI
jgi:hypothetical protein